MGIRTIQELRAVADEKFKSLPDDALVCEYSKASGIDANEVAKTLGAKELIPLKCEQVQLPRQADAYQAPKSGASSALIAVSFFLIGYFLWKAVVRRTTGEGAVNSGLRWAAFGVFLVFCASISITINQPPSKASLSFLILISIIPSTLFAAGFLFKKIRSKASQATSPKISPTDIHSSTPRNSEEIWAEIAEEMEGEVKNKALWAKSFSEANGNAENAKAIYMKSRYDQLASTQKG